MEPLVPKVMGVMTVQKNYVRFRLADVRALWIGEGDTGYLLYLDGVKAPFDITELGARQIGDAIEKQEGYAVL